MTSSRLLAPTILAQGQPRQDKPWFVRVLEDPTVVLRDLLEHALPVVELVALAGAVLGGLYLATRLVRCRARHWLARQGTRFEIALPEEADREALVNFFRSLALLLRPRFLSPAPWIGFAFVGEGQRLRVELFCSGVVPAAHVKGALEQSLRGAGIERSRWPELARLSDGHASSCSLVAADTPSLPLETHHASAPSRMVLAALAGQRPDEGAVVQLLLQPAPSAVRRRALARARKLRRGGPRSLWAAPARFGAELAAESIDILVPGGPAQHGSARSEAVAPNPWAVERAKLIEEKTGEPFLAASLRLAAFAEERSRARARRDFLAASFAPFHGRVGLRHRPEPFFWRRLHAWLPPVRARLLLTPPEAAALLPIPERAAEAPLSLAEPPARRMASVSEAPRTGIVVGQADREGFSERLLVAPEALLQHAHVLGPTGRGKSTWLLNLALAWIRAGYGLVLLDPKRDLVQALLQRMPPSRVDDVELLDLGDESHPPALNLLACRLEEADLHVEALAGIFRRLFTRFWGPRSEDTLRAALATLLTGGRTGAPGADARGRTRAPHRPGRARALQRPRSGRTRAVLAPVERVFERTARASARAALEQAARLPLAAPAPQRPLPVGGARLRADRRRRQDPRLLAAEGCARPRRREPDRLGHHVSALACSDAAWARDRPPAFPLSDRRVPSVLPPAARTGRGARRGARLPPRVRARPSASRPARRPRAARGG